MYIPSTTIVLMCLVQFIVFTSVYGKMKHYMLEFYRREYHVTETDRLMEQDAQQHAKRSALIQCLLLSSFPYLVLAFINNLFVK